MSESTDDLSYPQTRAQPDITSGPEVRKFSNVRIPDFRFFSFPDSGPFKIEKKKLKKEFQILFFQIFFFKFFFQFFFSFVV